MNGDTKRHIDAARQVLVGVVPNPTSQIDQITYALIYKFMDDMDQAAIKNGDEPAFFVGDLEPYSWARLMDSRIGNQDRMNLYVVAFQKFSEARQLPELFRNILKSAFLPYRSPETLGLFLREINYFDYSHPEELGNAYEYLLSIMSSQGDAGQFRTPRHIIDFIVDVVNPTKDDKVLDPACGTGGFLVSSYKHILEQHDSKDDPGKKEKPLTPDERKKLMANFEGYDIDPTMVRIAQVNMYLHQFKNPKIFQYDSLSSDEHWNDKFDVILANPPFMSPKGGIRPHNKFSIESSRSEVLFVDYIMNHLRPRGRAGIIVPEGIIFQSGTAYKQLRKNLVEDGLYAVASLPSGVFAPYSGVKTSILFFDNELAKRSDKILFIKISDDGFELGATRRESKFNDLPHAIETIFEYKKYILEGNKKEVDRVVSENGSLASAVEKSRISENGDYNLSGDRYRIATDYTDAKWPSFKLKKFEESGDITLGRGQVISKKDLEASPGIYPVYSSSAQGIGEFGQYENYMFDEELITWSVDGGGRFFYRPKHKFSVTNVSGWLRINNPQKIDAKYLFRVLDTEWQKKSFDYVAKAHPSVIREMYQIPLPPLEIQKQIVAELDGYAGIIAGTKQIAQNWKPKIDIDPEWDKVKLGEVGKVCMCKRIFKEQTKNSGDIPFYKIGTFGKTPDAYIDLELFEEYKSKYSYPQKGAILLSTSGTIGRTVVFDGEPAYFQDSNIVWIDNDEKLVTNEYLYYIFQLTDWVTTKGGTIERLYNKLIEETIIPLPPLSIQKQIVEKIEAERALVESAKKLIDIYEQKIKDTIAKLWTE